MNSILSEIYKLRKATNLSIDYQNSNRYRVVATEPDGSKTAYYFTTPIYNNKTRKAVDLQFYSKDKVISSTGSNTNITINPNIKMENEEGTCILSLTKPAIRNSNCEVLSGKETIYPTTNGVAIRSSCADQKSYVFSIEISKPFLAVRANDKYFALMSDRFRPFISISCIGTTDKSGNIISPAKLSYKKMTDRKYTIHITPYASFGDFVLIEANLYEPKLFQDTTVESKNPKINNVFGSVSFIGTTTAFGEQWLYVRPDFSKMPELDNQKINHAVLHIPKLNTSVTEVIASKVASRFCSFGSNWDNKVAEAVTTIRAQIADHYIDLPLTPFFSNGQGYLARGEGFIIKPKTKNSGYSVIPSGDNYYTPQILEINYNSPMSRVSG